MIVLWYDPQPMAGSSQAARTAMAARRPVVTNDTEWFGEMPEQTDGYRKVHSLGELERTMEAILARPYVEEHSWDRVAKLLLARYASVRVAA